MFILCPILVKDFTVNLHNPRNCINEETGQREEPRRFNPVIGPQTFSSLPPLTLPPAALTRLRGIVCPGQLPLCSFLHFKSILGETGIIHAPRNFRHGYDPGRGLLKCYEGEIPLPACRGRGPRRHLD